MADLESKAMKRNQEVKVFIKNLIHSISVGVDIDEREFNNLISRLNEIYEYYG